jgi:hydrogenase expression/formation protein HypC
MCLGIPGRIVSIDDPQMLTATVDVCGVRRRINIACIASDADEAAACIGAWVLVHVGFAMSRIDEQEAHDTLALLEELAEMQSELESMRQLPDREASA